MAHEHIARLKQENLVLSALVKRASREPLSPEEQEVVAELAKSRALEGRLRAKYDLGGAIERAFATGSHAGPTIPPQDAEVEKAVGGDNIETAIVAAFANTKPRYVTKNAGDLISEQHEAERIEKERIAKAAPDTRSKVRRDIESPGPGGTR